MTREEHLAWCKKRALAYADAGDLKSAVASMGMDLEKHPETKDYSKALILIGLNCVMLEDVYALRRWINGFQ